MEKLYKSLEQASLSPIGDRRPSTKKELRKSFIKRSKNPSVNEKLHKIRALNSTLKVKFDGAERFWLFWIWGGRKPFGCIHMNSLIRLVKTAMVAFT